ncbi:leucyl/phenylalanyl-tRNA--protein transferase [Photobacterium sp. WH77]|uniref:Leucyl/phenylalanyl-tRNA--protein transferase n=1 Tax=Photobacterium arenosum TaxID=2774143 RepID=A0ABR9BJF0_9GAMM|nr:MULTISPECIES: leucyl/phenylalanyl-tRNA--protein transferase [Photobacterium]MBD8512363.1 leucyl/phenylalanyl-tRNA--protein transferase [Photobacterium arenosum]MBV7260723.1 leucyl/phenylalanyl-tRNA--protein transferase [Photobacterium sp. WH24]MCG2835833.1 leucyl/phenylalanyl-tRNA--protein transferase [Photobacterium sp. WH77]MCG2843490.1 leucyl/phenylalanyl-tRNA--protein transferase [Photobacterium sp. WH80]MDO6579873.1 leucyl/phenylalanyl-tRNA--protein transferase [Photobacterium sp. 2_MG
MAIYLPELDSVDLQFPHPSTALDDPNGLLAFGGDLSAQRLVHAYRQGIFPWYAEGEPLLWWSPSPRAIILPEIFQPSKSLKKFYRKSGYQVTLNHACHQVIEKCAYSRGVDATWITSAMIKAYQHLHNQGHCHSVEVWHDDQLVGGLYGISVGTVFCGESMFSLADNASKIAFWHFCRHFSAHNGSLIDCQIMNSHLASLGAQEVPRDAFLQTLGQQRCAILKSGCYSPQVIA